MWEVVHRVVSTGRTDNTPTTGRWGGGGGNSPISSMKSDKSLWARLPGPTALNFLSMVQNGVGALDVC